MMMIQKLNMIEDGNQNIKFSRREEEVISYLIYGLTSKQIARKINISHRTVESYLDKIKNKLNCRSKYEVIIKTIISRSNSKILEHANKSI